MSIRDVGSYIGHNRVTSTSQNSASGIWSLAAVERRMRAAAWPMPVVEDPYFDNVSLLLHMDGTNDGTTFTDSSTYAKTVTRSGNTKTSTAQSKFGGASGYFDGNGDYLSIPTGSEFNFGTGDFTIECWVRFDDLAETRAVLGKYVTWASNADFMLWCGTTGGLVFGAGDNVPLIVESSAGAIVANTWYHVAACRSGGTTRLFIDGTSVGTPHTGSVTIPNDKTSLIVGGAGNGTDFPFKGYVDDLRITSVARYTANFTPPTAALVAH